MSFGLPNELLPCAATGSNEEWFASHAVVERDLLLTLFAQQEACALPVAGERSADAGVRRLGSPSRKDDGTYLWSTMRR